MAACNDTSPWVHYPWQDSNYDTRSGRAKCHRRGQFRVLRITAVLPSMNELSICAHILTKPRKIKVVFITPFYAKIRRVVSFVLQKRNAMV